MNSEIQTAVEKGASDQDQCVEDSLTPKKRSYAQMMASSPNSQEAHHSAEVSNKEATPDSEGSKSHLKRLKVMEPLASKDENFKSYKVRDLVTGAPSFNFNFGLRFLF